MNRFKFGHLTDRGNVEYHHPDVYDWEQTTGPARLVIAPRSDHLALVQALMRCWREPFGLLYVLVIPRGQGEPGRYQAPRELTRAEIEAFVAEHREFLEGDGRHALWVASAAGQGTIVYDRHNVIYAYGPLEAFEDVLTARGLRRGRVEFPKPHTHHYHDAYDSAEERLLRAFDWIHTPLRDGDED